MIFLPSKHVRRILFVTAVIYISIQVYFHCDIIPQIQSPVAHVLLWWTPFLPDDNHIIKCGEEHYQCILTNNRGNIKNVNLGAILFYGSRIENYDFPLPRNYNIPWAIFHEESPKNYAPYLYRNIQRVFNLSSTFSRNSTFPVPLQYLNDIHLLTDLRYYVPVEYKHNVAEISPVLYIQSDCDTPIDRDRIVTELSKYVRIDSYGACLKNKPLPPSLRHIDPLDLYNDEYMIFISQYKFIISIENAACYDYVTEKLWRPLIVGSIPIYYGAPNVKNWLPNDHSAILLDDFEGIEELGKYINDIDNNDKLYNELVQHKTNQKMNNHLLNQFMMVEHPVTDFQCFICSALHKNQALATANGNVYNCPAELNIGGTWDQHWDIGKCQAKALEEYLREDIPYVAEDFEKRWTQYFREQDC